MFHPMATDSSVDFRAVARPIAMMVNENEIMKRHMACQRQSPLLYTGQLKSRAPDPRAYAGIIGDYTSSALLMT